MILTREDMEAIINAGGSVYFDGRIITTIEDLPTQEEIDAWYEELLGQSGGGGGSGPVTETHNVIIDGGGSVITAGQKGMVYFGAACTLTGYVLLADLVGSIALDLWKQPYADYPPSSGESMVGGGAPPSMTGVNKKIDGALEDWVTNIAAGDIIAVVVDSAATITRCSLVLITERG